MVAGSFISPAVSVGAPQQIKHAGKVGKVRNRWSSARSHGSCVVADPAKESQARCTDGEISGGGFAAFAIRIQSGRSSGAFRSAGGAIRALGARPSDARILAGCRRDSNPVKQE